MSFLIVGLGNPGARYEGTRHNIGYLILDCYRKFSNSRYSFHENKYYKQWSLRDLCLLKPSLYMNRSGESLGYFFEKQKAIWDKILIIHDDMDIEFGYIKYSMNKGSGGHKGIESISGLIPENLFMRCRVGISKPPEGMDPADYVLDRFGTAESEKLEFLLKRTAESVDVLIHNGISRAANLYNRVSLI